MSKYSKSSDLDFFIKKKIFLPIVSDIFARLVFALLLVGKYIMKNKSVDFSLRLLFGIAGIIIFTIASLIGLTPLLPEITSSIIEERQTWWVIKVLFSLVGIGISLEVNEFIFKSVGFFLFLLSQFYVLKTIFLENKIQLEISAKFVVLTSVTSALFWLIFSFFHFFYVKDYSLLRKKTL